MHPTLESFDGAKRLPVQVVRPETHRHLDEVLRSVDVGIARGAGLSYSAASFGANAVSIDLSRFDRLLAFDAETGSVEVEPGVRVGDLSDFLHTRGRYLPALPGYPTITVGGCIAFDIHGKSQFHSGNFGTWVERLELFHRDHGLLTCSRDQERELFEMTIGGAGWTGVIVRARLRTVALPGRGIELSAVPVRDLREAADVLQKEAANADCLYSWNDLNRTGDAFGRGVIYKERFVAEEPKAAPVKPVMDIHARLRVPGWNRASTQVILAAYGGLARRQAPKVLPLMTAHFPIFGKEYYYAVFGRRGFREYQLVVPFERWPAFAESLRMLLETARVPVTLGSLKLFAGAPKHVRFQLPGICLALDVPATPRAEVLFSRLDELALQAGAIVNLSKDSRLSPLLLERLFPEYDAFRKELLRFDHQRRYRSQLRDQVGL